MRCGNPLLCALSEPGLGRLGCSGGNGCRGEETRLLLGRIRWRSSDAAGVPPAELCGAGRAPVPSAWPGGAVRPGTLRGHGWDGGWLQRTARGTGPPSRNGPHSGPEH